MEMKGYDFAKLSDEELKELNMLETKLKGKKGEDVVLIAYENTKK